MKKITLSLLLCAGLLSCKKSNTPIQPLSHNNYFIIIEVDKDFDKSVSTPIFWKKSSQTITNDGGTTYNWQTWDENKRKKWCDNHNPHEDQQYCAICPHESCCHLTPVNFTSWGVSNGLVHWETDNEVDIEYFSVQYGTDGNKFKEIKRIQPKGGGRYEYRY